MTQYLREKALAALLFVNTNPTVGVAKNGLLAFALYRVTRTVVSYVRAKGLGGAIHGLVKYTLQKTITLTRRFVPGANAAIAGEVAKSVNSLQRKIVGNVPESLKHRTLPARGLESHKVIDELKRLRGMDTVDYHNGKVSGAVYHGGADVNALVTSAFGMFTVANPLHPELFPGVRQMEAEIVSMVLNMYNAPSEACGSMTSGGTESILMAIKTYRDMAKELRGVTEPEMIVPTTIHTAFDKGAHYFGIKLVQIPVDAITGQVLVSKMASAINSNTVMIAASSPNFPHGIIDDIPAISALAKKYKIPMHVDACLGGFIVPFAEKAGYPLPYHIDFRNEGVTSISCDTHKYGFAPKGSSVVMYRSKDIRTYQYFVTTEWPGGVYGSPSMAGSRPGALVAGCWAALMHFGESGYVESTRQIIHAARTIIAGVKKIPQLRVIGTPVASVLAFESVSNNVPIFGVAEILEKKGWHLNILQNPGAIHIACTFLTVKAADTLVSDIQHAVTTVIANPQAGKGETAALYGMSATIPDRTVIEDVCVGFLDALTML
ncbi:pyridoxal phosphate-dependent transferase [Chytriomyces sp. MP71]|nr:pyridoxal phosphate-dependent transferase [Chytriomyces sp. MP71]